MWEGVNKMASYLVIEICNKEPLKIGAGGNKVSQTEPARDFIPGSTIRGAIIQGLIKENLFSGQEQIFLSQMECYNGYPYKNGLLYFPFPEHLRVDKHQWRKGKAQGKNAIQLTNLLCKPDSTNKNSVEFPFLAIRKTEGLGLKVLREYRLHHSTCAKVGEKERENLFRYQAIAKDQVFRALIKVPENLTENIKIALKYNPVYLGGSKGSGYGLCTLKLIKETTDYWEAIEGLGMILKRDHGSQLTITFLGDTLIRNSYGQPINYIPEEVLEAKIGCKIKLKKLFIKSATTEGYNSTWKARYPKETTIKAGSVLQYEFIDNGDSLTQENILNLERELWGYRTQDGYGWIGVNISYPQCLFLEEEENVKEDMQLNLESLDRHKDVLKIFLHGLQPAKIRWLQMLCKKNIEAGNDGEFKISSQLNNNQLRRLEEILKSNKPYKEEQIKREYEENTDYCSIAGYSFKEIINYLNSEDITPQYKNLHQYGNNMINSLKGKLFYHKDIHGLKEPEKEFIKDLLETGLEYMAKRERRGESEMQSNI